MTTLPSLKQAVLQIRRPRSWTACSQRVAELVKDITEFTESPEVSLTRLLKLRGRILLSRSLSAASALKAVNACGAAADACGQRCVQEPLVGDLHAAMLLLAKVLRDSLFERELSFASNLLDRCGIRACQWPALHYSRWRVARQGCKRLRVLQPGRHRKVHGSDP